MPRLISLDDVKQLPPGSRLDVEADTIISPLAADHAREHGVSIFKGGRPAVQPWPRDLPNKERDPRHFRDGYQSNWEGNEVETEQDLPTHINPESYVNQNPEGVRPEKIVGEFRPEHYEAETEVHRPNYYQNGGTDFERLPSFSGNGNLEPVSPDKRDGKPYGTSKVRQDNDAGSNWGGNPPRSVSSPGPFSGDSGSSRPSPFSDGGAKKKP